MATLKTVWGIDVGQCALKALKLRSVEGDVRVEAFDVIEHPKILSEPDADRQQLIHNALEQFLARNSVAGSTVVVSAPGQSGFTRFVKLPPVEPRQIPEIVRFEAEQQIPFNINDVIWRWQTFVDPDSPDVEVGIFAMKRPDVGDVLDRFGAAGISVDIVQMAPLALYNYMEADGQASDEGATLLMDVGTDKTDLVIADGARIWTRTLQLGGNNFTEALVKAFKLTFPKAEKLKRTAATSKYARQVFQAMRPVFAELVQEVQRSIGYYTSLHRDSRFKRVVGLGNGFRLPGLQKFLEQNLSLPVVRVDGYQLLAPSAAANAPAFTENVLSFAVSYGLALQGLGLTKIASNLLPEEIARRRRWRKKQPWFAAAAAMLLGAAGLWTWRAHADEQTLAARPRAAALEEVRKDVKEFQGFEKQDRDIGDRADGLKRDIDQYNAMLRYRDFWPTLHSIVGRAIAAVATDQPLMTVEKEKLEQLKAIPREKRRVAMIDRMYSRYASSLAGLTEESLSSMYTGGIGRGTAGPMAGPSFGPGMFSPPGVPSPGAGTPAGAPAAAATGAATERGYLLYLEGRTTLRGREVGDFLSSLKNRLASIAKDYAALEVRASRVVRYEAGQAVHGAPGAGPEAPGTGLTDESAEIDRAYLDPLTLEDFRGDTRFVVGWIIAIKDPEAPKTSDSQAPAQ